MVNSFCMILTNDFQPSSVLKSILKCFDHSCDNSGSSTISRAVFNACA
nr:MAG TPA: hypothetical protein [Bacteriophage sp.]